MSSLTPFGTDISGVAAVTAQSDRRDPPSTFQGGHMARRVRTRNHLGRDLLKGAIAGAVATFVMGKVTGYMYEHEDRDARGRRTRLGAAPPPTRPPPSGPRPPPAPARPRRRERLGSAIHWAVGIGAGAAYAVLRRRFQVLRHHRRHRVRHRLLGLSRRRPRARPRSHPGTGRRSPGRPTRAGWSVISPSEP